MEMKGDLAAPRPVEVSADSVGPGRRIQSMVPSGRPMWMFAVASVVVAGALIIASKGLWFYHDEWRFILDRRLTIEDLVRPHNEHWVAGLVLIYRGLIELVGTDSYLPFYATLIAGHIFAASGVLALLSQVTTQAVAVTLTILFLLLGSGSDNLLWAFQIGFVLSTGLGTWALAVAPRRPAVSAVLLTIAVATSGVGLFYVAATGVRLFRSRSALWLFLPCGVYIAWYLVAGVYGEHPASIGDRLAFLAYGLLSSAGSPMAGGPVVGAFIVVVGVFAWRRGALTTWSASALVGLVVAFALITLARTHLGPSFAAASRYLYVTAPFVLVIVAEAWSVLGRRPSIRRLAPVFLGVAITLNVAAFVQARTLWDRSLAVEALIPLDQRGIP